MNKFKAKLTSLLMAACCCLACLGVGLFVKTADNVQANAEMTTEQLTAEFTNNGQFTVSKAVAANRPREFTILDGSTVSGLPAGYSGAVLQVKVSDKDSEDGWDFIALDFSASKILAEDVKSVVVRAYVDKFDAASDEFRTYALGNGSGGVQYKTVAEGGPDLSTWRDITLKTSSITQMTDENGYLSSIELGIRDKGKGSHLYIDSITVTAQTYQEINIGKICLYGQSLTAPASNRLYFKPVYELAEGDKKVLFNAAGQEQIFNLESGTGILVNDQQVSGYFKQGDTKYARFYIDNDSDWKNLLDDDTHPDTVKIGGTFVNKAAGIKYILADSEFVWDGAAWAPTYTTYDLGGIQYDHGNDAYTQFYFKPLSGSVTKADDGNGGWSAKYSWKDGVGITINGANVEGASVKFPGSMFISVGSTVVKTGDVLAIGGTFYCTDTATEYKITESKFEWTGSAWVPYVEYKIHTLGELIVHNHSNGVSGNQPKATELYMAIKSGADVPYPDGEWDTEFAFGSGAGWKLNGESITNLVSDLESTNAGLYVNLANAGVKVGDVLSVEGTFVSTDVNAKYVIAESKFTWNGTAWEDYLQPYETGKLVIGANTKGNALYLDKANGTKYEVTEGTWTEKLTFLAGSGVGLTLNDVAIGMNDIKIPNNLYIGLGETFAPKLGDVLAIGGTFYNKNLGVKYIIEESKFEWNGTAWEDYIAYTTYELGTLTFGSCGTADGKAAYFHAHGWTGNMVPNDGNTGWTAAFKAKDGVGVTINGTAVNATVKYPGSMYIDLGKAPANGDVLVIGGTFYNKDVAIQYIIAETTFEWNGTTWGAYDETQYTTHELGGLRFREGSKQVYFVPLTPIDWTAIKPNDGNDGWSAEFKAKKGVGITVNGALVNAVVKFPGALYIDLPDAPNANDVLKIGGTFANKELAVQYVVPEATFVWNAESSVWEKVLTTYEVGKLVLNSDTNATHLYLVKESGSFEATDNTWTARLHYIAGSGVGLTLNGGALSTGDIKVPNFLYVALGEIEPKLGDVVAFGGTFYNEELAVIYKIQEQKFEWNGTTWVKYYDKYTVTKLTPTGSCGEQGIYLYSTGGDELPKKELGSWDIKYVLEEGSGSGVTINGAAAAYDAMKLPGDLYFKLSNKPATGDIMTIDGAFYSDVTDAKFIFVDCKIQWNGTAWVEYVEQPVEPEIEYTTYTVTKVAIANGSNASTLYLYTAAGDTLPADKKSWSYRYALEAGSGEGLIFNGKTIPGGDIKLPGEFYMQLGVTAKIGDVVTIDGIYYNEEQAVKIKFVNCTIEWTGFTWAEELEEYDVVSLVDIGLPGNNEVSGTWSQTENWFAPSAGNTTNSVVFRFKFKTTETADPVSWGIRLRGSAWQGVKFTIAWGNIYLWDATEATGKDVSKKLAPNTDYIIELGAISTKNGDVWTYVRLNDELALSAVITTDDFVEFSNFATTGFTNQISIHGSGFTSATISDANPVVTYVVGNETFEKAANIGKEYTIANANFTKMFIGWADENGYLWQPGDIINVSENITLTAVLIDFTMEDGAAIRLANTTTESGIRFTSKIKATDLNALIGQYGIADVSYGTLILPYDYLADGQEPNLKDFVPGSEEGKNIVKIKSNQQEIDGEYLIIRGAMKTIQPGNYDRWFAGRGYMEITFENGETMIVYTPFSYEDNVRSIRYVARALKADTAEYEALSQEKKDVVDGYAATGEIKLMNYDIYANNNMMLTAWYHPELDPSNGYNNDTNVAIANKMKAAGLTTVYLDGKYHLNLDKAVNIEETRKIINFFWSQGLKTIAFGSNASTNLYIDYTTESLPDFSDCEGFVGFLLWDEPQTANFEALAKMAENFEKTYGNSDVIFMVNLLPSYASIFNGTAHWWESSLDKLKVNDFKAYLQAYCDQVLSQISGEKWLSLDSYPICRDESLKVNFLFDLAMLKYYSEYAGATSHAVLQSSGWQEDGQTGMFRMPTAAELKMQAYAAMAFGIDTISWWSYSDKRGDTAEDPTQYNPTDSDANYNAFAAANNEIAGVQNAYSAFEWKGVILGLSTTNTLSNDFKAYRLAKQNLGEYSLAASNTKNISSVKTNKTNLNYLLGVMEDELGNEGYVLCNYNSHESDRTQTITITFNKNITKARIYMNGEWQVVSVANKKLAVTLATGAGAMILPAELG